MKRVTRRMRRRRWSKRRRRRRRRRWDDDEDDAEAKVVEEEDDDAQWDERRRETNCHDVFFFCVVTLLSLALPSIRWVGAKLHVRLRIHRTLLWQVPLLTYKGYGLDRRPLGCLVCHVSG